MEICSSSTNLFSNENELPCCKEENQSYFAGRTWKCLMATCALTCALLLILGSLSLSGHITLPTASTNGLMIAGALGISAAILSIVVFYGLEKNCHTLFISDRN